MMKVTSGGGLFRFYRFVGDISHAIMKILFLKGDYVTLISR